MQLNNAHHRRVALKYAATALFTAVFTTVVVSAFWIWFYSVVPEAPPQVARSGNLVAVQPKNAPPVEIAQQVVVGPAGLAIPVVGVKASELVDTFDDARSAGRRHDAIDIMAAEGTPVIAAADGTIEKLFFSNGGGGITIYERATDPKWMYYYAHLQGYAPGLAEGQQVKRGQVIARVDHTGDASPAGPHLHFAINAMAPGQRWWQGTPINPYPLLAGKKANG
ncbi:MAG TPA: M23 family metallopeptidase [Sphingomicrobium sp.]|nr:M23 family metallopeptidase [Sphingomicrobium sp.]